LFSYGSKVVGPETGIIYNNEMDDFSTPNTTNYFGVPASPANFIAPGKRPVSSISPLILVENDSQRIRQVLGGSGGTKITTSVAQTSLINLWFNENIKQAIDAPRLHSQLLPQEVMAEQGFDIVRILNIKKDLLIKKFYSIEYFKTIERTRS
jgi:gamma-glutamyltranspeptidase/glutathione hydrolase/leukotriene-C4 hydrolase